MTRKLVHSDLADRIRGVRRKLGLKRYQFAQKLGVTRATAGNYEMGQMPRADLLDKIAQLGGVSVEWLLHGRRSGRNEPVSRLARRRYGSTEIKILPIIEIPQLSGLPTGYVKRYQKRARELVDRLQLELKEYRRVLRLEIRAERRAKRGS